MKKNALSVTVILLILVLMIPTTGKTEELWDRLYVEPSFSQLYSLSLVSSLNDFEKVDYKVMVRSSSTYQKKYLEFTGTVGAFFDANNTNALFAISVDNKSDQTLICLAPGFMTWEWGEKKTKLDRLLQGDKVDVAGILLGIYDFGDVGWHEIPIFYVYSMSVYFDLPNTNPVPTQEAKKGWVYPDEFDYECLLRDGHLYGGDDHFYVVDINNKKIHRPFCSELKKLSRYDMAFWYGYRSTLIFQGYDACSVCTP